MAEPQTKVPLQSEWLSPEGPVCLILKAQLEPVGVLKRFHPAGFPEVGHVLYDAPQASGAKTKVCIVDSAASMANHLEAVCMAGPNDTELHDDLSGLPYVTCVTDRKPRLENGSIVLDPKDLKDRVVVTSLSEGHRIASDYFLDGTVNGRNFRELLREEFTIIEVKKDKTYFIPPNTWWSIYHT